VTELDLFRRFRGGVAAPSEHAKQRASEQLTASIEGKRRPRTTIVRLFQRRPRRIMLAFAAFAVATGVTLFASTPWQSSRGFLEPAQAARFLERTRAAFTPPSGKVLHFKVVQTSSVGSSCTVTQPPVEYWVDKRPPYKYRAFEVETDICEAGTSIEIGGEAASREAGLEFRASKNTLATWPQRPVPTTGPDWIASLRQELGRGAAHHAGRTVLDGRTVERIRIGCSHAKFPICDDTVVAYVDPKSLYPVRVEGAGGRFSVDFVKYEYLSGTRANRALADIRAQHPHATLVARKEQP
jgi:hypothetical protein